MDDRPIGVLDSGVGGLTIWKEILRELPQESTIYIGDSKHAPYGDKSPDEIFQLASVLIRFLLKKRVKLIVIACNVITTNALASLRNEFKQIAIVGTVPVIKKAVEVTKTGKIGVLSTNGTAKSHYQKHLIEQFALGKEIVSVGNNTLVPFIEKGITSGPKIDNALRTVLKPFQKKNIDVIALGCTHFPFLKNEIQKILGPGVLLLDSGPAIARQVKRILQKNDELNKKKKVIHTVYTTGNADIFDDMIAKLGIVGAGRAKRQNL